MFRFTIRDVLWFTVVVALSLGWCVYHVRVGSAPAQLSILVSILKSHGISVTLHSDGIRGVRVEASPNHQRWVHYENENGQGMEGVSP